MTITVEDGTGVSGANSYVSVSELETYATERGITLSAATEAAKEQLLIKAMDYIDAKYGSRFKGARVNRTQALHWPRAGVYIDGWLNPSNNIPRELEYGQLAAAVEADSGTDLLPNPTAPIKRERVEGAVEVEYFNPGKVYPVSAFAAADALLNVLCKSGGLLAVRS